MLCCCAPGWIWHAHRDCKGKTRHPTHNTICVGCAMNRIPEQALRQDFEKELHRAMSVYTSCEIHSAHSYHYEHIRLFLPMTFLLCRRFCKTGKNGGVKERVNGQNCKKAKKIVSVRIFPHWNYLCFVSLFCYCVANQVLPIHPHVILCLYALECNE